MTVVVDASVGVAALVDGGISGRWTEEILAAHAWAAPHLMPVETANILRRAVLAGDVTDDSASLPHADLVALLVQLFSYEPLAPRVWALCSTITAYDAWYVALAEALDAPLATLSNDLQLSGEG